MNAADRRERDAAFDRDSHRCQLEAWGGTDQAVQANVLRRCHGPISPHHRRKAGQGGAYVADNFVTLCIGHNDDVEEHPEHYRHWFGTWLIVIDGDDVWETLGRRWQRLNR